MICANYDASFKVLKGCGTCGIYATGETYRLSDLIPPGHCHTLLHSLIPYLKTLEHNGQFTWERHKDTVVVCCPAVDNNVCVELKKIQNGDEVNFQYRIMNVRGKCLFYEKDAVLEIRRAAFRRVCWNLFNVIFPYLRIKHGTKRVSCGMQRDNGVFELLFSEHP